jgi:type II secretory pathway pseudopilin PulG
MSRGERTVRCEGGFTYLGLLFLVALIGLALASAGQLASTTAKREREVELLFIGHQYRDAIGLYLARKGRYPQTLDELLGTTSDDPLPARYLRRLYRDPMTGTHDWVLVPALGGGIMGVASASTGEPLKHAGFSSDDTAFGDAATYQDWVFRYEPRGRFVPRPATAGGSPGTP